MADLIPLDIQGAWVFESPSHGDDRGYFREWFKSAMIQEKLGRNFEVAQSNLSKSKKGVVRGIHFSTASSGQAKWVTCANGAIWDVVVDIRPKSPTYKRWTAIELRAGEGKSLFIAEGLGHAFIALEDETVISYLLSSPYSPKDEFAINPQDAEIGITWPSFPLHFSEKDSSAPTLEQFIKQNSNPES
jgi:dTDP-4-dehydrorhamnose 3,5-epimerase